MTWSQIRELLSIPSSNSSYLKRWRRRMIFDEPLLEITDGELEEKIRTYVALFPHARGASMVLGHVVDLGFTVTQLRVRNAIRLVSAEATEARRIATLHRHPRVVYNAYGPGYLWHFDTNHKLGT